MRGALVRENCRFVCAGELPIRDTGVRDFSRALQENCRSEKSLHGNGVSLMNPSLSHEYESK